MQRILSYVISLIMMSIITLATTAPTHAQEIDITHATSNSGLTFEVGIAGYGGGGWDDHDDNPVFGLGLDLEVGRLGQFAGSLWIDIETQLGEGSFGIPKQKFLRIHVLLMPKYDLGPLELQAGVGISHELKGLWEGYFGPPEQLDYPKTEPVFLLGIELDVGWVRPFVRYRRSRDRVGLYPEDRLARNLNVVTAGVNTRLFSAR